MDFVRVIRNIKIIYNSESYLFSYARNLNVWLAFREFIFIFGLFYAYVELSLATAVQTHDVRVHISIAYLTNSIFREMHSQFSSLYVHL